MARKVPCNVRRKNELEPPRADVVLELEVARDEGVVVDVGVLGPRDDVERARARAAGREEGRVGRLGIDRVFDPTSP